MTDKQKTLGILNACTPQEEREFNSQELANIEQLLAPTKHSYQLREYRVTEGDLPEQVTECDAYLITGSPAGVYEDKVWIQDLSNLVQKAYKEDVPLVGICFGHQMIAQALGGQVEKFSGGWGIGLKELEFYQRPSWMGNDPVEKGDFYFCHQDQVMELPEGAERIAGNQFCQNGMFVIGKKVFALQAHPEFTPKVMEKSVDFLADTVGDDQVIEAAKQRYQDDHDGDLAAHWIIKFLEDRDA